MVSKSEAKSDDSLQEPSGLLTPKLKPRSETALAQPNKDNDKIVKVFNESFIFENVVLFMLIFELSVYFKKFEKSLVNK